MRIAPTVGYWVGSFDRGITFASARYAGYVPSLSHRLKYSSKCSLMNFRSSLFLIVLAVNPSRPAALYPTRLIASDISSFDIGSLM